MRIRVFSHDVGHYLAVNVNGHSVQTVNPRTKDWPKHDPDPNNCSGKGQRYCLEQGVHSWFNHAMDYNHADYPPGFDRSIDQ